MKSVGSAGQQTRVLSDTHQVGRWTGGQENATMWGKKAQHQKTEPSNQVWPLSETNVRVS